MFGYFANFKRDGEAVVVIDPYWPDAFRGNDVIEIRLLRSGRLLARFSHDELQRLIPVLRLAIGDDPGEDTPSAKVDKESLSQEEFKNRASRLKVWPDQGWFYTEDRKRQG